MNEYCLNVAYFPVALFALAFFMVVNLVLLPFAYLKTVAHKFAILRRYKGATQCQNFVVFLLLGIPLLVIA